MADCTPLAGTSFSHSLILYFHMSSAGTATATTDSAARPARSLWILGPWQDVVFIVATPLLVYLAIEAAQNRWTGTQITAFVIFWAVGHHLPGMMRAYGDRDLFRRFRWRFTLAPIVLLSAGIGAAVYSWHGLFLIGVFWGWWHYVMQTYGFLRIYDAKVGSFSKSTQWLDKAMIEAVEQTSNCSQSRTFKGVWIRAVHYEPSRCLAPNRPN